ncbi:MAG: hypothetical protein ACFHU9_10585 [Fluviicola sp.]
MKRIALIVLLLLFVLPTIAGAPIHKVHKYNLHQDGTLRLPTDFADAFLLRPDLAQKIKGKTIYHIDLVYTAYKEAPDFDQEALNNDRIERLKEVLPQINTDSPSWTWVEQEGATTRVQAKQYFHGFVLYYGDPLDFHEVRAFLNPYQTKYSTYTIKNAEGGVYIHSSGSKINIPANAVIYQDGTPVVGSYELLYREYRNQADIAFSGIPMTYDESEQNYNFSSAGMFELRAKQGDKDLKLAKPATVDFNCTRRANDIDFYEMDDETGVWEKKHPIHFNNNRGGVGGIGGVMDRAEGVHFETTKVSTTIPESVWRQLDKSNAENPAFNTIVEDNERELVLAEIDERELPKGWNERRVRNVRHKWWILEFFRWNGAVGRGERFWGNGNPQENNINATLLAEGANEGHTYPNLVRGLNAPEFGVYNCDQIYRIGTPVDISPIYVDAATGKNIGKQHVACVVDLNYNGSFSFHPRRITCNKDSRNVILLFTSDKKTYVLPEEKFAALKTESGKTPRFEMEDMTEVLKTSEDLKQYLNL